MIRVKHTDENGNPLDDKHEFYFLSECIAEVTTPMTTPNIGERVCFAGIGYIITDINHFPEQNAVNYTMERSNERK